MDKAPARLLMIQSRGRGGHARHRTPSSWLALRSCASSSSSSCRRFSSLAANANANDATRELNVRDSDPMMPSKKADDASARIVGSSAQEPWKTLLEMPARAKWRVSSPLLPAAIDNARQDVFRAVPPHWKPKAKVLQRVFHDTVFEKHKAMARQRDKERRLAFYDDDDDDDNKKKKRSSTLDNKPSSSSSSSSQPVLLPYGPVEAMAVLQHRLHPHYEIAKRVLVETQSLLMSSPHRIPVRRVIDFGMGVGSASLAALDVFGMAKSGDAAATADGIEWIHGIDASRTMHEVSGELLRRYCHHKSQELSGASSTMPRFTFSSHLSSSDSSSASATSSSSSGSFDVALCCYTAAELVPCSASLAAAAVLWDKLAPGGILVVIEAGTPDGFANVRTIRNMLLDCCRSDPEDDDDNDDDAHSRDELVEECHILAPCTHRGKCPMELYPQKHTKRHDPSQQDDAVSDEAESDADDDDSDEDSPAATNAENDDQESSNAGGTRRGYCSFVQAMPGSTGKAMRNKGEKFSYLVVQKRVTKRTSEPNDCLQDDKVGNKAPILDTSLTDLLRRTQLATHVSVEEHAKTIQAALDLEDQYLDSDLDPLGLELLQRDDHRASYGRILHAPIKRKGHVWIDCCTAGGSHNDYADGQIVRHSVSKSMSKVAPGIYSAARKSRWGGYWPNVSQSFADDSDDDNGSKPLGS